MTGSEQQVFTVFGAYITQNIFRLVVPKSTVIITLLRAFLVHLSGKSASKMRAEI